MFSQFGLLDLGTPELLIILAILLVLFGGKKLPELSKSIGESIKGLKDGIGEANDTKEELKKQASSIKKDIVDVGEKIEVKTTQKEA